MNDSIHNNQIQFLQPSSKQNKSNTMQTFFCFLVFFNQQKPNNVVLQRGRPEKSIFSDYCKSHVHKMASTREFSYFQGNFIRHSCHLFWLTSSTFPWWLTVNFTRQRASIRRPSLFFFVSVLQHSKVMIRKPEATHVHSLKKLNRLMILTFTFHVPSPTDTHQTPPPSGSSVVFDAWNFYFISSPQIQLKFTSNSQTNEEEKCYSRDWRTLVDTFLAALAADFHTRPDIIEDLPPTFSLLTNWLKQLIAIISYINAIWWRRRQLLPWNAGRIWYANGSNHVLCSLDI